MKCNLHATNYLFIFCIIFLFKDVHTEHYIAQKDQIIRHTIKRDSIANTMNTASVDHIEMHIWQNSTNMMSNISYDILHIKKKFNLAILLLTSLNN